MIPSWWTSITGIGFVMAITDTHRWWFHGDLTAMTYAGIGWALILGSVATALTQPEDR